MLELVVMTQAHLDGLKAENAKLCQEVKAEAARANDRDAFLVEVFTELQRLGAVVERKSIENTPPGATTRTYRAGKLKISIPGGSVDLGFLRRQNVDLSCQIAKLGHFIQDSVPGEPSRSEGAIDVAIRVIRRLQTREKALEEALRSLLGAK